MTSFAVDESTQDSAWYNCLPIMQRMDYICTRAHFKRTLNAVCAKLGISRERLGIVAAPWATMYFNGRWTGVGFDVIGSLARNGTDIIFIEKLDLVRVFCKYADKYGIALVNSHGHLSEYAKDLAHAAKASGAHVAIITDYDIPALVIASKLEGCPWLGVNEEMLTYFGLSKADKNIVVPYTPGKKAIGDENLADLIKNDDKFSGGVVDVEFLEHNKIEVDAVLATVGSERLWEYLMGKMGKAYPKRDYNRVIESKPSLSHIYPEAIQNFTKYIEDHVNSIISKESETIESELKEIEGFIEVEEKKEDIEDRLGKIIDENQHLKDIASKIEELTKKEGYKKDSKDKGGH